MSGSSRRTRQPWLTRQATSALPCRVGAPAGPSTGLPHQSGWEAEVGRVLDLHVMARIAAAAAGRMIERSDGQRHGLVRSFPCHTALSDAGAHLHETVLRHRPLRFGSTIAPTSCLRGVSDRTQLAAALIHRRPRRRTPCAWQVKELHHTDPHRARSSAGNARWSDASRIWAPWRGIRGGDSLDCAPNAFWERQNPCEIRHRAETFA